MSTTARSVLPMACLLAFACAGTSQPTTEHAPVEQTPAPSGNGTQPEVATPAPVTTQQTTAKGNADLISVDAPLTGALVKSPLHISGKARGTWYFEASFPVKLLDTNGKVLAQAPAQAKGDWMSESYVPFEIELTFDAKGATEGTLVLEKDNPSGLPEHADELRLPVRF